MTSLESSEPEALRTRHFFYDLPPDRIAQEPAAIRDQSRLMVFHRGEGTLEHRVFSELPDLLNPGDLLILNDSRVMPARLRGRKESGGGGVEILLLKEEAPLVWWVMLRPGKRVRPGTRIRFHPPGGSASPLEASVEEKNAEGWCRLRFSGVADLRAALDTLGEIPLPPYMTRASTGPTAGDRERYQTVYACPQGSVAAPTAGLHFTPEVLEACEERGAGVAKVTLHVGLATFQPLANDEVAANELHEETYEICGANATRLREARRIVAVGTTSVRTIESAALNGGLEPQTGATRLFIYPGFEFKATGAMLTNFHLPKSSLLLLVSAFAGPDYVLNAYRY
ncbi:MAG: tRNA preQ1(34) S-adenosylmethionine ribosyltransferase-isomerase QueA, partial [Verrucomicrobiae bacterium]|nr:tRNA preQ1(34) S-adenosylmethionine ribosyltransferase-isomerase QueA [Verrucomicrobiae bacterium]